MPKYSTTSTYLKAHYTVNSKKGVHLRSYYRFEQHPGVVFGVVRCTKFWVSRAKFYLLNCYTIMGFYAFPFSPWKSTFWAILPHEGVPGGWKRKTGEEHYIYYYCYRHTRVAMFYRHPHLSSKLLPQKSHPFGILWESHLILLTWYRGNPGFPRRQHTAQNHLFNIIRRKRQSQILRKAPTVRLMK